MRKRQATALLLAALMALGLTGCKTEKDGPKTESTDMTVRPLELTQEETALTELLGLEMINYHLFDFQLGEDSGIQSMRLTAYELVGGNWADVSSTVCPVSDASGRIALTFGKMTDRVTMAEQSASGTGSTSFIPATEDDVSGMTCATSLLTSAAGIELDQEIPLAVQIITAKGQITSYDVQYFGMPREYAKHEYEHVYAIAVLFSQKPVNELARDNAPGIPQDPAGEPPAEPAPEA